MSAKIGILMLVVVCLGFTNCPKKRPAIDPTAKSTPVNGTNAVPSAIAEERAKAAATVVAAEKKTEAVVAQSAVASAAVAAAAMENTNQPPSQRTVFVATALDVAKTNLPPPDMKAALVLEQMRVAILATNLAEANARLNELDAASRQAAQALKDANEKAAKASEDKAKAQAATDAAIARHNAELEANRAKNQAAIDAAMKAKSDAEAKAKEAADEAQKAAHKKVFMGLLGLGLACIAGAIVLGVMTQGTMLIKCFMLAGAGAMCIGLAQVISHPWFDRIFGSCLVLAAIGAAIYAVMERKDALAKEAYQRTAEVLQRTNAVKDADGNDTPLGIELSKVLDTPHKKVVKAILRGVAVKQAKAI